MEVTVSLWPEPVVLVVDVEVIYLPEELVFVVLITTMGKPIEDVS